jgi:hypothetical protein
MLKLGEAPSVTGIGVPAELPCTVMTDTADPEPAAATAGKPVPALAVTVPDTGCVAGKLLTATVPPTVKVPEPDTIHGDVDCVTATVPATAETATEVVGGGVVTTQGDVP